MTLSVQFVTLFTMIAGGFYLGLAKDTLRRFAPLWEKRFFLRYAIEITFWLMNTAILYYVLFLVNAGELRIVLFVAVLLGFSIYQALASAIYVRILEVFIRVGTIFFSWVSKVGSVLLVRPIQFIFRTLKKCLFWVLSGIAIVIIFILKVVFSPFKWVGKRLYAILPSKITKIIPTREQIYSIMKYIANFWKKIWSYFRR